MTEGSAAAWAQKFADDHLDEPNLGDWDNFLDNLTESFQDHTADRSAREGIEHFLQGKQTIDEFLNHFETLLSDANVESDAEKIHLLERNIHTDVVDAIYGFGSLPTTFAAYKQRAIGIGRLRERRQQQMLARC